MYQYDFGFRLKILIVLHFNYLLLKKFKHHFHNQDTANFMQKCKKIHFYAK